MNPSVTPTRHELEDCLSSMPLDVAGIVYRYVGNPFVTLWEVPAGIFRLPLGRFEEGFARRTEEGFARRTEEDSANDFLVNWGDGRSNHFHNDYFPSHTYSAAGQYRVHITGTIRGLRCGESRHHTDEPIVQVRSELLEVSQWGCLQLLNGSRAFGGCYKLTVTARDAPGLKGVKDLSGMFFGCVSLRDEDFSSWDTSDVTSMRDMFYGCKQFDGNVSTWSTSSVKDMCGMFTDCFRFNGDLSHWKTGCVTFMKEMFKGCRSFEEDLSNWNTGACEDMSSMFKDCCSFNGDLRCWDTSKVVFAQHMFYGCVSFKGDLSAWDVGNLYQHNEKDFESVIDCMCGGFSSVIPQDFRPSRRVNRLRSGKRWRI
jgi:surface protein